MKTTESLALKSLLEQRPVAALATLHQGAPAISMVPFALMPEGARFIIHVSGLATHTGDLLANPAVALLVTASGEEGESPLALPRVSIQGRASACAPDSPAYRQARAAYLAKLPDAEELFSFADFSLFLIETLAVRYVAGFGKALSLTAEQLAAVLSRKT